MDITPLTELEKLRCSERTSPAINLASVDEIRAAFARTGIISGLICDNKLIPRVKLWSESTASLITIGCSEGSPLLSDTGNAAIFKLAPISGALSIAEKTVPRLDCTSSRVNSPAGLFVSLSWKARTSATICFPVAASKLLALAKASIISGDIWATSLATRSMSAPWSDPRPKFVILTLVSG